MNQTLLIANADAEVCDICKQFLINRGYDVAIATDGLDCLRKLRQLAPSVLVLDLDLRWGGGEGVLAWLREESLLDQIAVVVTTAASPDCGRALAPVVAYLAKPFTLIALLETVRSALATLHRHETMSLNRIPGPPETLFG
jgi:CheY-like chemotaxis protein